LLLIWAESGQSSLSKKRHGDHINASHLSRIYFGAIRVFRDLAEFRGAAKDRLKSLSALRGARVRLFFFYAPPDPCIFDIQHEMDESVPEGVPEGKIRDRKIRRTDDWS
jgi:hypothetical protein